MRAFIVLVFALLSVAILGNAAVADQKYGAPSIVTVDGAVRLPVSPVSGLPVCNALHVGIIRIVSDSNTPTFGSTHSGGGTVLTLAVCNGTNWVAL